MALELMVQIPFLEKQHLVNQALPGLAKRKGIEKEEAWRLLEAELSQMSEKVRILSTTGISLSSERANLNSSINRWYNTNRKDFATLGLNVIEKKKPKASSLNYDQLAVIVLLDEIFARKSYIQKEIIRGHEKIEKPSIRQRLCRWWKNFKYNLLK